MAITIREYDHKLHLGLPERFDYSVQAEFRKSYETRSQASGLNYVLDFSRVNFMDSAALGMLFLLHDFIGAGFGSIQAKERVELKNCSKHIKDIMEIARLGDLFKIS